MDFYSIFISELKKKVLLILILMFIFGIGVGVEKGYFNNQIMQTTTFETEKVVRATYSNPEISGSEFDYGFFASTYAEVNQFLNLAETQFDIQKFNANWPRYTAQEKLEWIRKHIFVNNIKNGTIQYEFILKPEDPKDLDYTKQMGENFLDFYINYNEKRLHKILPVTDFVEVNHFTLMPEPLPRNKNISTLKYGIVGMILGMLIGVLSILIITMRKYLNARA